MDRFTKGLTVAVTLLFLAVIITLQVSLSHKPGGEPIVVTSAVFMGLVYTLVYYYRPVSYELNSQQLIINRPGRPVVIQRHDIASVEPVGDDAMNGTIRVFGVGGLFGYYGIFSNSRQGRMTWYATRKNNMILVKTRSNEKIVLTPDEPAEFLMQFFR